MAGVRQWTSQGATLRFCHDDQPVLMLPPGRSSRTHNIVRDAQQQALKGRRRHLVGRDQEAPIVLGRGSRSGGGAGHSAEVKPVAIDTAMQSARTPKESRLEDGGYMAVTKLQRTARYAACCGVAAPCDSDKWPPTGSLRDARVTLSGTDDTEETGRYRDTSTMYLDGAEIENGLVLGFRLHLTLGHSKNHDSADAGPSCATLNHPGEHH